MKRIFNFKMYKEGITQLRLIGTIFLLLSLFINPLIDSEYMVSRNSLISINYMILLTYTVIVPVMTLYLFSFMTKRSSSDFYDALPCSRACLYISYCAAIVTWITGIMAVASVTGYLCKILMGNSLDSFSFFNAILAATGFLACCLLVMASINISQMITGTLFTNVVVSGIIIFLPRTFISVIISTIEAVCPYLDTSHMFSLLNPKYNLVFASVYSVFTINKSLLSCYTYVPGIIYTLILAMIYLVFAIYLCKIRKSEAAGFASPTRILQAVIRCTICLTLCLPSIYELSQELFIPSHKYQYKLVILFYILAVFAYFIYEIISTRKTETLKKIFPGLIIVIILNVISIATVGGVQKYTKNVRLQQDDIEYFTIEQYFDNSYLSKLTNEYPVSDSLLISMMLSDMEKSMNRMEDTYFNDYEYTCTPIAIHTKNKTYYRKITLSESFSQKCRDYIASQEDFIKKAVYLPDNPQITYYRDIISKEDNEELYKCFKNELAGMPLEEQFNILCNASGESVKYTIDIGFTYKGEYCYSDINISINTPVTYNKYLEIMYTYSQKCIEKNYYSMMENSNYYFDLYDVITGDTISFYLDDTDSTLNAEVRQLIARYFEEIKNCTEKPTIDSKEIYEFDSVESYLFVPTEKMKTIIEEMKKY